MGKIAVFAAQVKSVCDFLHQYEGVETRQLRRMQVGAIDGTEVNEVKGVAGEHSAV
jgi:hypothetical protein